MIRMLPLRFDCGCCMIKVAGTGFLPALATFLRRGTEGGGVYGRDGHCRAAGACGKKTVMRTFPKEGLEVAYHSVGLSKNALTISMNRKTFGGR